MGSRKRILKGTDTQPCIDNYYFMLTEAFVHIFFPLFLVSGFILDILKRLLDIKCILDFMLTSFTLFQPYPQISKEKVGKEGSCLLDTGLRKEYHPS